jgi:hypothetical protein
MGLGFSNGAVEWAEKVGLTGAEVLLNGPH